MKEKIGTLFDVFYGQREYTNKSNLSEGGTLLISSKGTDNGCFGFFDIPPKFKGTYPIITVPRTGSIGASFVQDHECCVDDDCLILEPLVNMTIENLYEVAFQIRKDKWRYNYGRKITPDRIKRMVVQVSDQLSVNVAEMIRKLMPKEKAILTIQEPAKTKTEGITSLFYVQNARSKGFRSHQKGFVPFVTNGAAYNGVIGFVKPLNNEKVFFESGICLSSFCEATIHHPPFLPRGNGGSGLLVLTPKIPMDDEELFFYATQIGSQQWRFSYGRMVIQSRLNEIKLTIPVNDNDTIDRSFIHEFVRNRYGYGALEKYQ